MDIKTFYQSMPKAELHVHIEGTLEPTMVRDLASRNNIPLPRALSALELKGTNNYAFDDLSSFLAVYYGAMGVLHTSQDFFDLAYAYLLKCRAQNIVHAEIFFDPQAHTSRGVAFSTVITGLRDALSKAQVELGVSAQLIMCFLRDMSAESAMATLDEALSSPYKEWISGVGLDSDERGNPPSKFAAVFTRARREGAAAGWKLTCHCDIDQENSIEHIRQAVRDIGVDRIDHGTNIVEDGKLVDEVRGKGIGLTCCPISNSVVTRDFKGKEMMELMDRGVRVTVNSDDPAYFRGYVNENLALMCDGTHVGFKELTQLQRNAFMISWIDDEQRNKFLKSLDDFVEASGVKR
ncbi:hypothetical protein AAFC00_004361 [Neodothiora populina]|uniref:Adenine deaminase n=1 Tax=Neodothiora populina TaxID=2781224 RepID=A0ABR3PJG7_9PEZI